MALYQGPGQQAYTPGIGGLPFGNQNANPQSSNYATISGFSPAEENLIQKAIMEAIFDTSPEQYKALRLVFDKTPKEVNLDEFEFLEKTFGRSALVASAGVVAVPAVAGGIVTQVIPMTAASLSSVSPDATIVYPDGTQAVVHTIAAPNVTVASHTSDGLPAVNANDVFAIMNYNTYDGSNRLTDYERTNVITRYNFVQLFMRAKRWGFVELQKFTNAGTTDYLTVDKQNKLEQYRTDLFNTYWNGERGEIQLFDGGVAKTMGGIFPTMQAAGSMNATTTLAGLPTTFETLSLKSNFKKEGASRFVYGTQEVLHDLSKSYKSAGTRYAPNDNIAKLDLMQYEFGGMKFVPVPTELFREPACFPSSWARRIFVLDQDTITPVKMKGIPMMEIGETLPLKNGGTREQFTDWWVRGNMSVQFNNPVGSFWMDVV